MAHAVLWPGNPPRDAWHSFDRTPWRHPWLAAANLRRAKQHSEALLAQALRAAQDVERRNRYGFVCNIANGLYHRAVALRKRGMDITVFTHPDDRYVMSHPEWEEYDGVLDASLVDFGRAVEAGVLFPSVPGIVRLAPDAVPSSVSQAWRVKPSFVGALEWLRWYGVVVRFRSLLNALQEMDALLSSQAPYLAYLAKRPYLVTQMGGDIWYECSHDDRLGRLQRTAYFNANAFLVSNPWSYAHARRFGMRHLIYLPVLLDEEAYSPGIGRFRSEWAAAIGGEFFVLCTARLDDLYKGSKIALDGFARFAALNTGARLVVLGWGADRDKRLAGLRALGIADKTLVLPLSGKRRLIEYLRSADCLLDQLVLGYYGSTALESMACGLPVLMRLETDQYAALCETGAPPVLNCATPQDVAQALERLSTSEAWRRELGERHRAWFLANHSAGRWKDSYDALLALTVAGKRLEFSGSPLAEPLS
ncbi:MAG TPA: glycosyltransferase, partial [Steroidobacteraceae bacterium]|nr:glycosyltransferase [Steroidobacteraceae bacterium]